MDVPYISQEGAGARRYRNDCGPACIEMIRRYYGLEPLQVDQLSAASSLARFDNGLTVLELQSLAARFGLKMDFRADLTVDILEMILDAGKPVICLINYSYIKARQNQADRFGHFVVATGYDDKNIIILDPDFWGSRTQEGNGLRVPRADFALALSESPDAFTGLAGPA